jgi:uncharacterized pyridoxamine 5'-phosphate oxidase family protein
MNNTNNQKIYQKLAIIGDEHAKLLAECAEFFSISKVRMSQVALYDGYKINSVIKNPRFRYGKRLIKNISITMTQENIDELDDFLKLQVHITFTDLMRRAIERLHNIIKTGNRSEISSVNSNIKYFMSN